MSRTISRIMGTVRKVLSSRTWRLRSAATAVLVVLAGGWALGVAGLGGETARDRSVPLPPTDTASDTPTPEELDPSEVAGADPSEAGRSASETAEGSLEPIAETPDGDPEEPPAPPRTRTPAPTPTQGTPSPSPRPPETPRPTPRPSPTEPADCADPSKGVDCLLAPITRQP